MAHISFPPYTKDESLQILSLSAPAIFLTPIDPDINYTDEEHEEDSKWVWNRFCGVVWDSIGKGAARDLVKLRRACEKLWRPFVQPVVDGTFGTRDFSRLLVNRRALFQGETALGSGVVAKTASGADSTRPRGMYNDLSLNDDPDETSNLQPPLLHQIRPLRRLPRVLQPSTARPNLLHEIEREEKAQTEPPNYSWKSPEAPKDSSQFACSFAVPARSVVGDCACAGAPSGGS